MRMIFSDICFIRDKHRLGVVCWGQCISRCLVDLQNARRLVASIEVDPSTSKSKCKVFDAIEELDWQAMYCCSKAVGVHVVREASVVLW